LKNIYIYFISKSSLIESVRRPLKKIDGKET
jgi:hypothetical protein